MNITIYCDESKQNWKKDGAGPSDRYFCIAGILLPEGMEAAFSEEIRGFKRRVFGSSANPELAEIKGSYFAKKIRAFSGFTDHDRDFFREELARIIFQKLGIKVLAICDTENRFELVDAKRLSDKLKLRTHELSYFLFLLHYNAYLKENGYAGKVVFDEGNHNFIRLLNWMKNNEGTRAFDLSSHIDVQADAKEFFVNSTENNMVQIADVCAYTIAFWHTATHLEKRGQKRVLAANRIERLLTNKCPVDCAALSDAYIEEPCLVSKVIKVSLMT